MHPCAAKTFFRRCITKNSCLPARSILGVPVSFLRQTDYWFVPRASQGRKALHSSGNRLLLRDRFVDFLPAFWCQLKQPVLLQGSWWRKFFFLKKESLTLQFVRAAYWCVVLNQTVMLASNSLAVAVGGWPSVQALRFGRCFQCCADCAADPSQTV